MLGSRSGEIFFRKSVKNTDFWKLSKKTGYFKMIKDFITPAILGLVLAFGAIFGVDAEVARKDRAEGREVTGCLFSINCWQAGER